VNDTESVGEAVGAASLVTGAEVTLADLTPAVDARLVDVDDAGLRFRHPPVRSAIRQAASVSELPHAQSALASVLPDLGANPWSERARQELRASGESSRRRVPEVRDELTPQELQIAQLAATGLTNREIGEMLYLSHRTISSHLYRTFPKLGITSRGELRDVLERGTSMTG